MRQLQFDFDCTRPAKAILKRKEKETDNTDGIFLGLVSMICACFIVYTIFEAKLILLLFTIIRSFNMDAHL